jgi:hypothetical protein
MKIKFILFLVLGLVFGSGIYLASCKREPVYIGELPDPTDTTDVPPLPIDSVDWTGTPCSPDSVYFQNQIFPIINSSCAIAGCHDAITHEDDINLTSYQNIRTTGKIKVFNAADSKFYKVLNDPDPNDRMPPAPYAALTADQKALIFKWINQGALENGCNENYGQGCKTTDVTYSNFIQPLVANACLGCHSNASTGGNILLKTYDQVKANATTGEFYNSIAWVAGTSPMPKNTAQLSPCFVEKVKAWVDAGMPQ